MRTSAHDAVALVAVQRVAEMVWSTRNEGRLRRRGGVESGRAHYPVMVALHAGWLVCTAVESRRPRRVNVPALVAYGALQPLRYWVIRSLGDRWTTRIVTIPGEAVVTDGAFRWFRHPNYMIVAAEIALLPLAFGATRTARVFTVLNVLLMAVRIPTEQRALSAATHDTPTA